MKILYVKNNSARVKKFQLTTIIYEEDGQKYVKKEASSAEAIPHLMAMKHNYEALSSTIIDPKVKLAKIIEETPTSLTFEFIEGISLEKMFYGALETSDAKAQKVIEEYREFILSSFKTKEMKSTLSKSQSKAIFGDGSHPEESALFFEPISNIDLIFSNIIYKNDEIYIIDYEWVFDFPLPVDYVYFRAIASLNDPAIIEKLFNREEIRFFQEQEAGFTLRYVFDETSFYQTQHFYLKNRIDPTQEIEENKHTIQEKEALIIELGKQIKEAQEIAQSLRIKNRLKRLDPRKLLTPLQAIQKNPALFKKVLYYAKRGEFGYLWDKVKEKNSKNISQNEHLIKIDPIDYFEPFHIEDYPMGDHIIDIIIPVYNGYEFLTPLFDSIERNTTSAYRLIVVNDCSPDERVKPLLLERLKKHPVAIFIDHEVNLGFVKSVNEAYTHTSDHFLILNTDTEVPEFWLERLMFPILNMQKIATTTPFTNSGQIASFPNFIADNDIFEGMGVDTLDKVFRKVNPDSFYTQVPTGVGFCMGVNYDLIQEIGFFVEEEFGRGYGEENDWCQRAIGHGYKNLMVPNLFVYHKHGGSFSAEDKKQLMKENAIKLLHKHPNYDKDVEAYVRQDPHKTLRDILVIVAASQDKEGVYLVVDQALGGGANHYTQALVENYLTEGKKVLQLIYDYYAHTFVLHFDYREYHFSFAIDTLDKVKAFISQLRLQEIFVNNIVSFQEPVKFLQWIEALIREDHTKLIIPIHDYYPICQNYTLLNPQAEFCEIPDALQECQKCLKENDLEWKTFINDTVDIQTWRREWGNLLGLSDTIICFSHSSKELLLRAYKDLDSQKIEIIPHQVAPLDPVVLPTRSDKSYTTLGILGAINQAKGAGIIETLIKEIDDKKMPIKIVLIGEISNTISSDSFLVTGRYQREELPQLIAKHEIDICLIPSVCPETFSYTTQEIMMMEMPLMVFDLGAPAERVKAYDKGIVLEKDYIQNILGTLEDYKSQS